MPVPSLCFSSLYHQSDIKLRLLDLKGLLGSLSGPSQKDFLTEDDPLNGLLIKNQEAVVDG